MTWVHVATLNYELSGASGGVGVSPLCAFAARLPWREAAAYFRISGANLLSRLVNDTNERRPAARETAA